MPYLPALDRIRGIPAAMGVSPDDADDIAQRAALACLEYEQHEHRSPGSELEGTITRRRCVDHFRACIRTRRLFAGHSDFSRIAAHGFDPSEETERDDTRRFVRNAASSLPTLYSETLRLAYWDGLSDSQIAQRLNISEHGVRKRMQRARKMLRPILESGLEISPSRKFHP